jgi:hypothetical protein
LAQRSSRKRRKAGDSGEQASGDKLARGYARGRAKDEAARAALEPLEDGERPRAVTIAALVAFVLGAGNLISYFAGVDVEGEQPAFTGILVYSGLMFTVAYGCFRSRYWGVLGMQALLALALLIFGVLVIRAESILALAIGLAVIGSAGTLFWKLVKSMARIQMPERPGSNPR